MKHQTYSISFLLIFSFLGLINAQENLVDSDSTVIEEIISSGTGFLISNNGHIVTSYHIVDEAKSISVEISAGDSTKELCAEVVLLDIENDLALLKVNCDNTSISKIPFTIITEDVELGSSVYTLGFPMVETMGKSIKLSNGIISSTNGFMGNDHTYQISVPINPGNSGGPLFDEKGNLVGVIKSIYSGAENVAYAVKSKHVQDLCKNYTGVREINMANKKEGFVEQVRSLKDLVCLIVVTN